MKPDTILATLLVVACVVAWICLRPSFRRLNQSAPIRNHMVCRLTILYVDPHDAWAATHAYFEGPDFTTCRSRAAHFLQEFTAGRSTHDIYHAFPCTREPRDVLGADLCDEFRGRLGETVSYVFQPGELM